MEKKIFLATLLLIVHELHYADASTAKVFYPTLVLTSNLTQATQSETFPAIDELVCAMAASQRPWCHLLCYRDQTCTLYDLRVRAYQVLADTDTDYCKTDIGQNVCELDGKFYEEGEIAVGPNCESMVCKELVFVDSTAVAISNGGGGGAGTCPVDYTYVAGAGCLRLHPTPGDPSTAPTICGSEGAQLVVPDDFEALRRYAECLDISDFTYIGASDGTWNDGNPVIAPGFVPEASYPTRKCGGLKKPLNYGYFENDCNSLAFLMCQIV